MMVLQVVAAYIQDEKILNEIENTTFTKNMVIGGSSFNGGGLYVGVKNIRLRNVQFIENTLGISSG
ncbi:MAG: hypothetical protein IPP60_10825 [Sphingobacteriales bacterium]|nr:hypothetical protein [Sphingobacteriales bacterium]